MKEEQQSKQIGEQQDIPPPFKYSEEITYTQQIIDELERNIMQSRSINEFKDLLNSITKRRGK